MGRQKMSHNESISIVKASNAQIVEDDDEVEMNTTTTFSWARGEIQPPAYRDCKFAIIFILHLILIAIAACISPKVIRNLAEEIEGLFLPSSSTYYYGLPDVIELTFFSFTPNDILNIQSMLGPLVGTLFSAVGLSMVLTIITLYYFRKNSERIIKVSIVFSILSYVGLGLWILLAIDDPTPIIPGILLFIIAAFYMGYAYSLWDKIPFAASTLSTGATACKANLGVFGFAFISPLLHMGIFVMHTVSIITFFDWIGVFNFIHDSNIEPIPSYDDDDGVNNNNNNNNLDVDDYNYTNDDDDIDDIDDGDDGNDYFPWGDDNLFGDDFINRNLQSDDSMVFSNSTKFWVWMVFIFYMISLYWTSEVIKNISTVTVSGTVGTWWFTPHDASSCCSNGVMGSFRRATTYSFGSICFGSLVSAIVNAIVGILREMQRDRRCICLYCVVDCLLQCIEYLVEYFNKWAFVYVGLYGYKYTEAGKKVMDLFQARGWSTVISHSLIHRAMFMVATCISVITGLVIGLFWGTFEEAMDTSTTGTEDGFLPFELFFAISFLSTFLIALLVANTFTSVVSTASDTTLVCFAEGSKEFQTNHPQLSIIMREKFAVAYPNINLQNDGKREFGRPGEVV